MSSVDRAYLKSIPRENMGLFHFTIGMNIRNSWYLWWHEDHGYPNWPSEKPEIIKYFNSIEIYHADDMSGIIFTTVFRKYYNKPIDLESQIKVYHEHWLKYCGNINPNIKEVKN